MFANRCHSDLASMSWKGHPVHLTDPYIICSNYLRFSENGFDVKIKIVAAADAADTCDTAGTN